MFMTKKFLVYREYGKVNSVEIPVRHGFSGMGRFCKVNPSCPEWVRDAVGVRVAEERLLSV